MKDKGFVRNERESPDRMLWIVGLAAVAVRVAGALYQANAVEPLPGIADQVSYHTLALRVLHGNGFSFETGWWPATAAGQPTAHWSYLYVLILTGIYSVFGPNPLAVRLIQAVAVGTLQTLLTFRIGKRLFDRRVGLISAGLAAANGYFVLYSGALMTESLYIVAILWIIDIGTAVTVGAERWCEPAAKKTWLFLGLGFSGAVLLRQAVILIVPVILSWVAWRAMKNLSVNGGSRGRSALIILRRVSISVAVIAVAILPWTIRNYKAFNSFVLLNTNAGFAFYWANHPIHGTRFLPLLPQEKSSYGALIPPELRALNEADLDRELMRRGLGFVWDDPVRYVRLSLSRIPEYFKFWPSVESSLASNYVRVLSYGVVFPFIVIGLVLGIFGGEKRPENFNQVRAARVFAFTIALLYALIHVLSWSLIRYRLPMDAITLPFAAFSMVLLYDWLTAALRPAGILKHRESL